MAHPATYYTRAAKLIANKHARGIGGALQQSAGNSLFGPSRMIEDHRYQTLIQVIRNGVAEAGYRSIGEFVDAGGDSEGDGDEVRIMLFCFLAHWMRTGDLP